MSICVNELKENEKKYNNIKLNPSTHPLIYPFTYFYNKWRYKWQ